MKKTLIFSGLVALLVTVTSLSIYSYLIRDENTVTIQHVNGTPSSEVLYSMNEDGKMEPLDFTQTAEKVIDAVVHIKSTQTFTANRQRNERRLPDPFRDFFGDRFEDFFGPRFQDPGDQQRGPQTRVGAGSGVIINENGYIVTNNHVVAGADDIEVTLHDNRTYKASVIGTDPTTDLALIQIKEKDLPALAFVNSDDVKVGEWVMAVGNPFSLNSTVTAGIVSAKGRNINILKEQYAIENFIQTDAAINPGNSGGALVNLNGGLVGINTAIASPTGVYSGYGFAVPSNLVSKVVEDLLEYGTVQRGVLGILIRSVDGNFAKEKGLNVIKGVYVDSLLQASAAEEAGLRVGDVILKVNDIEVNTSPELQGIIGRYRPGEEVTLTVSRNGREKALKVTLKSREGGTAVVSKEQISLEEKLGIELETVDSDIAKKLEIPGGVKVKALKAGIIKKYTDMRESFIITKVDSQPVKTIEELNKYLKGKKGGVLLEGIYEDIPGVYYYAFGM